MVPNNNEPNKFDLAAIEAKKALTELIDGFGDEQVNPTAVVEAVQTWWKSWYMHAGHKRLGRLLRDWQPSEPTLVPAETSGPSLVPPDVGDPE